MFENVNFKYAAQAEKFALSGVDLKIKAGQTVGILGGTGASKSTLVNLIPRLYDTTEGAVYVGGVNVKDYDIEALRNKVAMVLQKNVLFSGTIKENLRWGKADATDEEIEHACKLACADDFIQAFPDKYDTYIEQGGSNVSGGQKQRLWHRARPSQGSQGAHSGRFDQRRGYQDRRDDPQIFPRRDTRRDEDHHRAALFPPCRTPTRSFILNNGRIDAVGTHEELLKNNEIYQEVYYSQNKIGGAANEQA